MKDYPCTSCGICCHKVKGVVDFPYGLREDGACEKLGEDNKCTIYNERPLLCNVESSYYQLDKESRQKYKTKLSWYRHNVAICNDWIKDSNIDKSFLIDLSKYK